MSVLSSFEISRDDGLPHRLEVCASCRETIEMRRSQQSGRSRTRVAELMTVAVTLVRLTRSAPACVDGGAGAIARLVRL